MTADASTACEDMTSKLQTTALATAMVTTRCAPVSKLIVSIAVTVVYASIDRALY